MRKGETLRLIPVRSYPHSLSVPLLLSGCLAILSLLVSIAGAITSVQDTGETQSVIELYDTPFFPEGTYDSSIPDPESFLRLSGLLWPEARKRWKETAYLTREGLGKGQIILFAGEPHFRAYFYGSGRLLANAILLGPGFGTRQTEPWRKDTD